MMNENRQIAVWMDNSHAILMEMTSGPIMQHSIVLEFEETDMSDSKNDAQIHNRELHEKMRYFQKISEMIIDFHEVLLFGQTGAKNELYTFLKSNHLFQKSNIEVQYAEVMTEKKKQG